MTHRKWAIAAWEQYALAQYNLIEAQPFILKKYPSDDEFRALEIRKTDLMAALAEAIGFKSAQKLHQDKLAEEE